MVKRLLDAYRLLKASEKLRDSLRREEQWTFDDAISLNNNPAAHKWMRRLYAAGQKACVEACGPTRDNSEHKRGMAYGLLVAWQMLRQDFPQSVGANTDNSDDSGEAQPAEEIVL